MRVFSCELIVDNAGEISEPKTPNSELLTQVS